MSKINITTHFTVILQDILNKIPKIEYYEGGNYFYVYTPSKLFRSSESIFKMIWNEKTMTINTHSKKHWEIVKKVIDEITQRLPEFNIEIIKYFIPDEEHEFDLKDYLENKRSKDGIGKISKIHYS